ncbi:hypothetical protein Bca4012_067716 [Brassica carinata]
MVRMWQGQIPNRFSSLLDLDLIGALLAHNYLIRRSLSTLFNLNFDNCSPSRRALVLLPLALKSWWIRFFMVVGQRRSPFGYGFKLKNFPLVLCEPPESLFQSVVLFRLNKITTTQPVFFGVERHRLASGPVVFKYEILGSCSLNNVFNVN